MSKHLFAFRLTELGAVRIGCSACGTVVEMPVDRLASNPPQACPDCAIFLWPPPVAGKNPLRDFALAVAALRSYQLVEIEFVLPVKPDEPKP